MMMNLEAWVEQVYRDYFHLFLSIGVRNFGLPVDTAKDRIQETFVKVWKNKNEIKNVSESGIRGYTIRIFRNVCINHLRRKPLFIDTTRPDPEEGNENEDSIQAFPDERSQPLYEMLLIEEMRLQEKAIHMLPERYRETVRLTLNGLKPTEIARATGLKMTELNNYKHRGFKKYEAMMHQLDPLRKSK